jgi:hypothetical protein
MRREKQTRSLLRGDVNTTVTFCVAYLAELVETCSYCGVPCSGTVLFWYPLGDERVTVEVDTPSIRLLIEGPWPGVASPGDYATLPSIVRHYNECTGWSDTDAGLDGVDYDPADLLGTIDLARRRTPPPRRLDEITSALTALCDSARAAGQRVFLRED